MVHMSTLTIAAFTGKQHPPELTHTLHSHDTNLDLARAAAREYPHYAYPRPVFAPVPGAAVDRRDNACSELPKLCTDEVMIHDAMTTMTYLCPEETNGMVTVTVTTTKSTTVTEVPTDWASWASSSVA